MDRISISGIEAFGHHGALPHERSFGQPFLVDVALDLDLAPAAGSDDLGDTIDYGAVAGDVADIIAGTPVQLIETVAGLIAERCLADRRVTAVEVTVHKPSAPVPVLARDVSVTLHRSRG